MGDATEAAGFLVDRAGYLDGAGIIGILLDECLDGDDRGGEPALHVACAPPIDTAIAHDALERIHRPAVARLDHVEYAN